MSNTLLYIRKRQAINEINQLKVYSIVFLAIIIFLSYQSFFIYQDKSFAYIGTLALAFICFGFQSVRKDKEFLFLHSENFHLSLYMEYSLLTFPFIVMSLFTNQWYCFPLLQIFLFLIPYNKFTIKKKTFFKNISEVIPVTNFEWISGFRKSFTAIITIYFLALGFSWLKILPLFLLWFLTLTIISFYNECEPLTMLRERKHSAGSFLNKKLSTHIRYLLILYSPVLIINTFFNNTFLALNIFFLLSQAALLFFAVCYKYSNYEPNQFLYSNNIIVNLVSVSAVIPVLLPVPVIMSVQYYFKAKNNLNKCFND